MKKIPQIATLQKVHLLNLSWFDVSRVFTTCYLNVQVKVKEQDITFALKVIKKKHVVDNRQEEHIHSERKILAEARSPFVVKSVLFQPSNKLPYFFLTFAPLLWEALSCLLSFYLITVEAPWQIVAFQLDRMAGDVKMSEMRIYFFF